MPSSSTPLFAAAGVAAGVLLYALLRRRRRQHNAQPCCRVDGCDVYCVEGECAAGALGDGRFWAGAYVGLDCEWNPRRAPRVAVVQVAAPGVCAVVRVSRAGAAPPALAALLRERVAVGVGVRDDAARLLRDLGLAVGDAVDLRDAARAAGALPRGERDGLAALASRFAPGASLPHKADAAVRASAWDAAELSRKQVEYAAGDAIASFLVLRGLHGALPVSRGAESLEAWLAGLPRRAAPAPPRRRSAPAPPGAANAAAPAPDRDAHKAARRRRYERWHEDHAASKLYDNIELVASDGARVLGMVNEGKASWYVGKGMATREGPRRVVLTYEPDFDEDPAPVVRKANACVGCGAARPLTRFYVVPYRFRRCFPLAHKSNNSHDVVPLCLACRYPVDRAYRDEERRLEAGLAGGAFAKTETRAPRDAAAAAANVARTLLRDARGPRAIPEGRRAALLAFVADAVGAAPGALDDAALEALAAARGGGRRREPARAGGDGLEARCVRALLDGAADDADVAARVQRFQVRWRSLFVDVLRPRRLPPGWVVDHEQRPRRRPPPGDQPCRAHRNGRCAWGDACKYSHAP